VLTKASITSMSAISSEPPREDYADNLFANRTAEIGIVTGKIDQAQTGTGKITRPLIEFYAVKGQGKSWLLKRIFNLFASQPRSQVSGEYAKPPLVAHVDFDELVEKPALHSFLILRKLASELHQQSKRVGEIPYLNEERAPTAKKLEKSVTEFVRFVQTLTDKFVPVLIFDTTDHADEQVLEWLEEKIVFPLIQSDQAIFILAGRRRLFWKYFDVRRRVEAHELLPLDEQGSAEQFKLRNQDPQVGKLLFRFSKGHPEINWRILYGVQYDQGISTVDQTAIELHHKYILERVREVVDSEFLVGLSKEAYELLWDTCVLRRFHTAQLRYFAGLHSAKDKKRPEGDYLDLIQQMIDIALVHWDSDEGGYVLDATVRAVMLENLKERDRKRFIELQKDALGLYKNWAVVYPENSQYYLLEIVFHESILLTMKERHRDEFLQEFGKILANPKLPNAALEETEFPSLLEKDRALVGDLSYSVPGLCDEILACVASAREAKSRE